MRKLIVAGIGLLAAVNVFFVSTQVPLMADYTYFFENAYRIYLGQLPYRDFILVLTPGTYAIGALIMKIGGLSIFYQTLYCAVITVLTVLVTYNSLQYISKYKNVNILLLLPFLFSGHVMYAFPSYDINAVFFALLSVNIYLRLQKKTSFPLYAYFFVGTLFALPFLFKQNLGILFLAVFSLFTSIHIYCIDAKNRLRKLSLLFAGSFIVLLSFWMYLALTHSVNAFLYQAFIFSAQSKQVGREMQSFIIDTVRARSVLYYLPFIVLLLLAAIKKLTNKRLLALVGYALFLSPFLYVVYLYFRFKGLESDMVFLIGFIYLYSLTLWYVVLFAGIGITIYGKGKNTALLLLLLCTLFPFTLHRAEAATYAFYPFLLLLIAMIMNDAYVFFPKYRWNSIASMFAIGIVVCLCFFRLQSLMIVAAEKIGVVNKNTPAYRSILMGSWPGSSPGAWSQATPTIAAYIQKNIPATDSFISLPGEDPVYFLTKRTPPLPYFQLLHETLPYSPKEYAAQIENKKIQWVLAKKYPQGIVDALQNNSPQNQVLSHLYSYKKIDETPVYVIYKRLEQ